MDLTSNLLLSTYNIIIICGLLGRAVAPSAEVRTPVGSSKTGKVVPVASLVSVHHIRPRAGPVSSVSV